MRNIFTEHPRSVNESYLEHMKVALYYGINMSLGAVFCTTHSFLPFIFKTDGSNILFRLIKNYINRVNVIDNRIIELNSAIDDLKSRNQKRAV
jgi:hypothetical protein